MHCNHGGNVNTDIFGLNQFVALKGSDSHLDINTFQKEFDPGNTTGVWQGFVKKGKGGRYEK
jgi:hypothetical protein